MRIKLVSSAFQINQAREIFREYQLSLGVDLCFQDFENELATLPGKYAPPQGRLYLGFVKSALACCIALRPFQEHQCEMKRLYVRPDFRGQQLGITLATTIIADARQIGYRQMFLDTLPTMKAAQKLYGSLGFLEIPSYCLNPVEGAIFMCLDL